MDEITYGNLVQRTLDFVPEIQDDYQKELAWRSGTADESMETVALFKRLREERNLPESGDPVGEAIVFEDMLTRFIVFLGEDKSRESRLKEIMAWVEELANHQDFWVRNAVAIGICEPLLTTHESRLKLIFRHMGPRTKDLCRMQLSQFRLDEETIRMFDEKG